MDRQSSSDTDDHSFSSSPGSTPPTTAKRVTFQEPQETNTEEDPTDESDSSEWGEGPPPHSSDSDSDDSESEGPPPKLPLLPLRPPPAHRLSFPPIAHNERAIDVTGLHYPIAPQTPPPNYTDDHFLLLPLPTLTPPTQKSPRNSLLLEAPPPTTRSPRGSSLLLGQPPTKSPRNSLGQQPPNKEDGPRKDWLPEKVDLGKAKGEEENEKERGWRGVGRRVFVVLWKTLGLLYLLYMFVCSLDLLSLGFRLIGGRSAGEIFRKSDLLQNPVVGVMMGILTTVLVQSSSTSTSIIVGMVSAGFLKVPVAIPLIMGANIGTSITNTIVSFSQAGDREQFRRAFAGATLLDVFNWLTVIVLLTVEVLTGYLYHVTSWIMQGLIPDKGSGGGDFQLLSRLTRPFVNLVVQLDRTVLDCWSTPNCTTHDNSSLIRRQCESRTIQVTLTQSYTALDGGGGLGYDDDLAPPSFSQTILSPIPCSFLFAGWPLADKWAGAIILVLSLFVLCSCLILIVKLLNSVLQGQVAVVIERTINADIPYVPWMTGYIAIGVGALMTFLVQSSSVFTSALTPLIGLGVISVERAYPLTLGSNIGTTTTALIASLAVEGDALVPSIQIALCHLLFNVTGILLFYPVPFLRFPIPLAKWLGNTTAQYRWFAILYMVLMFGLFPALIIGLSSFGNGIPVIVFLVVLGALAIFVGVVTCLQRKKPEWLPGVLQTWKWLPAPLRSLRPYDDFFVNRFAYCQRLRGKETPPPPSKNNLGGGNPLEEKPQDRPKSYHEHEV